MVYNPQKAHEYYMNNRDLKGQEQSSQATEKHKAPKSGPAPSSESRDPKSDKEWMEVARARVGRLQGKVSLLEGALTKTKSLLSQKRRDAAKEERKNSDNKTTSKERQNAKEYRDTHKSEIEAKRKSGSSSSGSTSKTVSSMSVDELGNRVSNLNSALVAARKQLSDAKQSMSSFAHSAFLTEYALSHTAFNQEISRKESVKMTVATVADFGGYATRSDIQCADGRTILPDAFKDQDGTIVPLVYQHDHVGITNVLGHCRLEARPDGVYAHAYFNDTDAGQTAKKQVEHGDLKYLSIFANKLRENIKDRARGIRDVVHGSIKEVSLVIAGANPGAFIDQVNMAHGEDGELYLDDAIITSGLLIQLTHADTAVDEKADTKSAQDIYDSMSQEQQDLFDYAVSQALLVGEDDAAEAGDDSAKHSDTDAAAGENDSNPDNTSDDADANVAEADSSTDSTDSTTDADADANADADADTTATEGDAEGATEGDEAAGDNVQHDDTNSQEDNSMKHNVFDDAATGATGARPTATLSHSDLQGIIQSAKRGNSTLRDAFEDYAISHGIEVNGELKHGIEDIDLLFPDAKLIEQTPAFLSRRMEWVADVLASVRKAPFAKIKTISADITPDEARARGYITGNFKEEEFFKLSKRETTPGTVYKKQRLDRDNVIDITDLEVVVWMKGEMRAMLDEEIATAILIGDGRSSGDDDKIKEENIRPIAGDSELYATTVNVNLDDANSKIDELIDAAITNRMYYKGTGTPTFYTTERTIGLFLTAKDGFGHRLYKDLADVADAMRVSKVVAVPTMERVPDLIGIMVNLQDYTVGTNVGGQVSWFDDFNIDYNKLIYLIETRMSGALTVLKSALVFRSQAGANVELAQPTEPLRAGNVITVPTVTSVTYKNAETNATLVTGTPITLAADESLYVKAYPAAGKYFPNNAEDEWVYEYEA